MQSIIVYRNPLEAAAWEMLMTGEGFVPIFAGIIVFFAILLTLHKIAGQPWGKVKWWQDVYLHMGVSAMAAVATVWKLWV